VSMVLMIRFELTLYGFSPPLYIAVAAFVALWPGLCLHHILKNLGGWYIVSTHLRILSDLARRCLLESFAELAIIHLIGFPY